MGPNNIFKKSGVIQKNVKHFFPFSQRFVFSRETLHVQIFFGVDEISFEPKKLTSYMLGHIYMSFESNSQKMRLCFDTRIFYFEILLYVTWSLLAVTRNTELVFLNDGAKLLDGQCDLLKMIF